MCCTVCEAVIIRVLTFVPSESANAFQKSDGGTTYDANTGCKKNSMKARHWVGCTGLRSVLRHSRCSPSSLNKAFSGSVLALSSASISRSDDANRVDA